MHRIQEDLRGLLDQALAGDLTGQIDLGGRSGIAQQLGVQWHAADITVASALSQLKEALQTQLGGTPDIVVNSAGAFELASIVHTSVESFDRQMAVNLRAVFLLAHTFLPGMLERRSGHFVTIGSVAGRVCGLRAGPPV